MKFVAVTDGNEHVVGVDIPCNRSDTHQPFTSLGISGAARSKGLALFIWLLWQHPARCQQNKNRDHLDCHGLHHTSACPFNQVPDEPPRQREQTDRNRNQQQLAIIFPSAQKRCYTEQSQLRPAQS